MRAVALASLVVLAVYGGGAAAETCGTYTFNTVNPQDRIRNISRALARVHPAAATSTERHVGAATVIRQQPLLLVTAGHVAREDAVQVSFPNFDRRRLFAARVIARASKPVATAGGSGDAADFAVLQVQDPPPAGVVGSLEIWLDEVNIEATHDFAGFGRDSPNPIWGRGWLAHQDDCAWRVRETTFNGDSGGAVVHESGLLVGIVLLGVEGGQFATDTMGQAAVLPLTCVRGTIMAAVDHAAPIGDPNILDVERAILLQKLKPPASPGWIDNLEFARGLREVMKSKELARRLQSRDVISCPIVRSHIERKLGYKSVEDLIAFAAANTKEAGDLFKKTGDLYRTENVELAKRLYASATTSYDSFVATRLASPTVLGQIGGAGTIFAADITQAMIARAHTLTAFALIDSDIKIKSAAVGAAVQAVNTAAKTGKKGEAYAILGNAAFNFGDYQTAIEAFSSAKQFGYTAPWVKNSYVEAFRRRDNIIDAADAKDFVGLGTYRGLDRSKLLTLGGGATPN